MSGPAVVIIIGGGTEQQRSADTTEEEGKTVIRVKLNGEGSVSEQLRTAADVLDGNA